MDQGVSVYDLGEIDSPKAAKQRPAAAAARAAARAAASSGAGTSREPRGNTSGPHVTRADRFRDELDQIEAQRRRPRRIGWRLSGSLALVAPGSAHLLQGELAMGFFFVSALGLCATLAWATVETLWRLVPTLDLFGLPAASAFWALGWIYLAACLLYIGNVLSATTHTTRHAGRPASPVLSGVASAVVPGWGQLLNGDRLRAVVFLTCTLALFAVWLSITPGTMALLDTFGLYLPYWRLLELAPTLRWTVPLLLWALAIYDAAQSATARRAERRAQP